MNGQLNIDKRWAEVYERAGEFASTFVADIEPGWYPSPIKIPEGRSGKIRIRHRIEPAGTNKMSIVAPREAMLRGVRPAGCVLQEDTIIHELSEDKQGVWMTDIPAELNQAQVAIRSLDPCGAVLVGGLGLGILPVYLAQRGTVDSVTVVERNKNVIKLTARPDLFRTVHDNIAHYIRTTRKRFDAVFLDTWQGQSESTFWNEVFPLRRLVHQKFGGIDLWCWKDEEFMAQAYRSLRNANPTGRHWYHKKLKLPLFHDETVFFLTEAGTPEWEKRYANIIR